MVPNRTPGHRVGLVAAVLIAVTAQAHADCKTCPGSPKPVGYLSPNTCFGYFPTQWARWHDVCCFGPSVPSIDAIAPNLPAGPTGNAGPSSVPTENAAPSSSTPTTLPVPTPLTPMNPAAPASPATPPADAPPPQTRGRPAPRPANALRPLPVAMPDRVAKQ
ncbi:MAG: hypothetical protein U0746_07935 [Gemmataceae bacterium]